MPATTINAELAEPADTWRPPLAATHAIATHRIRNSFNSSGDAVRRDLPWAVSISRGGACPRPAPSGCSAKSACHGSRLRARRGGPVRGHPREANVTRSPHLVDVDVDLCGVSFLGASRVS